MTGSTSSPTTALFWFLIITTIYFVIKYNITDATQNKIYFGIYVVLLLIGEYIINLSLTNTMCGSQQWNTALLVTLIPWVFIFGILNVVLQIFPGWLAPFSNTFGYGIAKLMGVNSLLNKILKPKLEMSGTADNKMMAEALEHIYTDKSLLINEITPNNFDRVWTSMSYLFNDGVANNIDLKTQLLNFIRLKDIVAEFIWYMLTGGLVTSVGYNYVVNAGCSQSVKDMKRRHKEYEETVAKASNNPTAAQRVYTMTD
jgi:hypothetical protein